ncbi:hypothetical protein [Streptomyces sp. NPDC058457]|uniref:hypothetical protein n=1 Tax=Streptomyces sp. NPDC058457 TaxID=3346507 RepID=UPI00365FD24E
MYRPFPAGVQPVIVRALGATGVSEPYAVQIMSWPSVPESRVEKRTGLDNR